MDIDKDGAAPDMGDLFEGTKPPSQGPSQPADEDQALEDILAQASTHLSHTLVPLIKQDAMNEASKDDAFRKELRRELFRAMIRGYIWSNARLTHETQSAEARLTKGVRELLSAERDQDRLRARLGELMAAVGKAMEAFVHFG